MLKAEIAIERPPETVWTYFTEPGHWGEWWGGGLASADWVAGGRLIWALGGGSSIAAITPGKSVVMSGSWFDTTWTFEADGPSRTKVVTEESAPKGGASFSDGGAAHLAEQQRSLARLKACVERDT